MNLYIVCISFIERFICYFFILVNWVYHYYYYLFFQVAHFRHRLDNNVTSTRERVTPYPVAQAMIRMLIECDDFEDIATLKVSDKDR